MSNLKLIKGCSFDGGGVKAIDEAVIVDYIEKKTKRQFSLLFDRVAGTSAGSQIAAQIVYPNRPISGSEIIDNFRNLSSRVFSNPLWRKSFVAGGLSSKYRIENLSSELSNIIPNSKLKDSTIPITIPTIDGNGGYEMFLKTENEFCEWDLWAAACASSAAPYYFDGFIYKNIRMFDGGGAFNNPSRILYRDLEKRHGANHNNCFILSLGCTFSEFSPYPNGGIQWLPRLFEFGNRPATNTTATFLSDDLGERHVRILIPHAKPIALDESNLKRIDSYVYETKRWISRNEKLFDFICDILINN